MFAMRWTYLYTNTYFVRLCVCVCGDGLMKAIASDRERVCPITIKFIAIMRRSISRRAYKHRTAWLSHTSHTHTNAHISCLSLAFGRCSRVQFCAIGQKHMQRPHSHTQMNCKVELGQRTRQPLCGDGKIRNLWRLRTFWLPMVRLSIRKMKHERSMWSHYIKSKFPRNVSNHTNDDYTIFGFKIRSYMNIYCCSTSTYGFLPTDWS